MGALKPVGVGTVFSTSTSSARSVAIPQQSDTIRVVAEGAGVHISAGVGEPTATVDNFYVGTADNAEISIGPVASQRIVGITTGSSTTLDFPEGTGCPFAVGDTVSLTVDGQTGFDFSHAEVTSINNTADQTGFFNTRIVVDHDSSTGHPAALTGPYATLRKSIKVAAKTNSGTGTVFIQQVQVS